MLIAERVDRVLREQLGDKFEWTADSPLREGGLELDSLDLVELTMRLEEEFTLPIPDDECEHLVGSTVGALGEWIERQLALRPALFA